MGIADRFADGQWNFYCDLCGAKKKSSEAMKTWDNFYVCKHHKEKRNPQDFLRGVREVQNVPWARPESVVYLLGLPLQDTSYQAILDTSGQQILPL